MYLKSLTLKGFKSFADRTRIVLEPGVTVVVGPNGSGKSNITDAVLWVLGEQSAKSLRGQSMEDVIFAGSSARRPVGVSEVDLVLDNRYGTLPLEFAEITITRRMFRNGESEYLVNQSPARLMDIQDLLSDSGLGRDTHSIISQGRLEEMLNSKPEDRRILLEEAAGIRKHKKRKERALRKLKSMDGHIDAVRHILREIDRQLQPLQRQADRANQHDELTTLLRETEIALAVDELRILQATWDALLEREGGQDSGIELQRLRLAEQEQELDKFQSLLEEKGLFAGDLSEQRRRLQAILERLNSGLLLLEEKGKNLVERLSELRAKVHHSETRLASRREEVAQLTDDRSEADGQIQTHYQRLAELRREGEAVKKGRLAAEAEVDKTESEIFRARKRIEALRSEVSGLTSALSSASLEETLLRERLEALDHQEMVLASTLSARRNRVGQLERAVNRTKKELALADADVDKRVRVLESRRQELADVRDEMSATRAESIALEKVDRVFEGATPALAWALSKKGEIEGIVGAVTDCVTASADHTHIIEHALGADLFSIVVKDEKTARRLLSLLEEQEVGDVSLIPADARPSTPDENSPGDALINLIDCDAAAFPAVAALVGDVHLVDSLGEALAAARNATQTRFATPDGHLVWPSGKISLGPTSDTSTGVLARRLRMNELDDMRAAVESRLGEVEASVADGEEAVEAAQQDALELGQRYAMQSGEFESLREEVGRLEQSVRDITTERDKIDDRLTEIEERVDRDSPQKTETAELMSVVQEELETLEKQLLDRRKERDARYREEAGFSTRLSECQSDIAQVSQREVLLKSQMTSATVDLADLEESLTLARQTEEALELLRERISPIHGLHTTLLGFAEHWAHKLKDRASFEQSDSESIRDTIHESQSKVKDIQSEIDVLTGALSDIRVEKGQLEVQVRTAVSRIVEGYCIALETALDFPEIDDRGHMEETAHQLRKRLSNLGPVNPVAAEEFGALEDRRGFLQAQMDDLLTGKKALHRVVLAIDRKMRDRFNETFEQVDKHFQEVFGVLFPGGHAALTLTEEDDPSETGVEVVAQPRGKKLTRMSLMSGGEKSLVALALLFALYHTRPCPFYVLDEVEAALDDVNLRRFIGLIDTLRSRTQFIVITHQRRTMEMADLLYGVSMQADGVSKVVSQKLEGALEIINAKTAEAEDEHAMV